MIDENYERILDAIRQDYEMDTESVQKRTSICGSTRTGLFFCATGMCRFSGEEISERITAVCLSIEKIAQTIDKILRTTYSEYMI